MKKLYFLVLINFVLFFDVSFCMTKQTKTSKSVKAAQKKAVATKDYVKEKAKVTGEYLEKVAKPAAVEKAKSAKEKISKAGKTAKEKIGQAGKLVKEKVEDIPYARKLTGIDKRRENRKQAVYKLYAKRLVMDAQEDLRKGLGKSKEKNDAKNLKEILDEMVQIDQEIKFAEILSRKKDAEITDEEIKENEVAARDYLSSIGVKNSEIERIYNLLLSKLANRAKKEEELVKREEKKDSWGTKIKNFFNVFKPRKEKEQDVELSRLYARKKFEKARSALREAGIKEEEIDKEIDDLIKEGLFEAAAVEYSGTAGAKVYSPKRARGVLEELGVKKEEAESISDFSMTELRLKSEGEELGKVDKFFDVVLGSPGKALRNEELMRGEVKRGIITSTKEKATKTGKVVKGVAEETIYKPAKGLWERYQK